MEKHDLVIIGGGPGGYVAALRASQLKKKVLLVEEDKIGGTCMNYGCIPTKYLLHQTKIFKEMKENKKLEGPLERISCNWKSVQKEKQKAVDRLTKGTEFLLKKNGVEILKGKASLRDERHVMVRMDDEQRIFEAQKIILATGSRPAELPFLKLNGQEIVSSQEALEFESVPAKLIVIGAGAIGLEIGSIYARLGTDVCVLEILPTILPGSDKEIANRLERLLKMQGLKIFTRMRIETGSINKGKVFLRGTCLNDQSPFEFEGEKVLLAAGRMPNSEELKREAPQLRLDKAGFVEVNPQLETAIPGIYAIGDLIGGKLLAHKASHEGLVAAENVAGMKRAMDYKALPMAVFTEPEFASVGLSEEEASQLGIKLRLGVFSLQASGRALTMERPEGMVKIVAGENDEIIGGHILAPGASEIIAELTLAIHKRMKLRDVASSIHIHPTLSEAVMEAAMKAKNEALHILNK